MIIVTCDSLCLRRQAHRLRFARRFGTADTVNNATSRKLSSTAGLSTSHTPEEERPETIATGGRLRRRNEHHRKR